MAENDDDFKKQKLSGDDAKRAKYGDDCAGFSVRNSGIENGLVTDRKCTDMLMLILFVAFLGAMGYVTAYANKHGDLDKLMAPLDGDDNFCGISAGFEDYGHLYITDLSIASVNGIFDTAVCVKECPQTNTTISCKTTSNVASCGQGAYDTKQVLGYCFPRSNLPDSMKAGWKMALDAFLQNPIGKYFNDLYLSSRAIYWSMAMGVVYCFILIAFLSAFAEPIAWICVALIQIGLLGVGVAGFFMRQQELERQNQIAMTTDQLKLSNETANKYMMFGILGSILALLFCVCIFCGFRSLKLAIDVIDASADFLNGTKRIILVPVFYFFLTIMVLLVWVGAFASVASMNNIVADTGEIPQAKDVQWNNKNIVYMAWFMLFGLLWINAWLQYTCNFIVMVSASTYYFDSNAEHEGVANVGLGFTFAYFYHAGSLAAGAFIIAVIQFIRIVFVTLAQQAERASGENQAVKLVVACANCMLKCLEKICDYINAAAFSYMAVSGESFCSSAWNGFLLNVKHTLKFSFANMLAKVFIFLGKAAVTVGNIFSCYFIMKNITKDTEEVSSLAGPLLVVGIVTYMTASIFLGLFDTAVMAMMTCLAIDMDLHDGEPHFGPPTFHDACSKIDSHGSKVENEGGYTNANELA